MAACRGFSLQDIRILLERNQIPFKLNRGPAQPTGDVVTRAAAKAGPSIVVMVDSFKELPEDLQELMQRKPTVPNTSPDHVRTLILGGKQR